VNQVPKSSEVTSDYLGRPGESCHVSARFDDADLRIDSISESSAAIAYPIAEEPFCEIYSVASEFVSR